MNGEIRDLSIPRVAARAWGGALALTAGLVLGGCVDLPKANPFAGGPVDSRSAVASQTTTASGQTGPLPRFSDIPAVPTDVRPASAWRTAVTTELAVKRQTEAAAAAVPFSLANTQTWAAAERAKIPAREMIEPNGDNAAQTEAYANAQRARATPPPSSN